MNLDKNFNNITIIRFLFLSVAILLTNQIHSQTYFNNLENPDTTINWIGLQTIDSGFAYSGYNYSHTDSLIQYGLGIHQEFPENIVNRNTLLVISAFARNNNPNNNALYVVTIEDENKKTQLWKGIHPGFKSDEKGKWNFFSDTILIPASSTKNSKIKSYLWNKNRKNSTDLDDLKFELITHQNPSFIPVIKLPESDENQNKILFINNYYSVYFNEEVGSLSIKDHHNKPVLNDILYYSERVLRNHEITSLQGWKFKSRKNINNGRKLIFSISEKGIKSNLEITCLNQSGEIHFTITNRYSGKQNISRESLIIGLKQPISEIYRHNRKLDNREFQDEYWLDNEGLKTSDGNTSMIIYHEPDISSLQLNSQSKQLIINLDFDKDHPFFRFPLNPDSSNWKLEESFSQYKKRSKRKYSFSVTIAKNDNTIPRFMKNPAGFESTYIWSEHADFTNIRTNRAVYFGSEKIQNADSATGGFVYFNIPVTKSVFYDNPDSVTNFSASGGLFSDIESSILTDSLFEDFLIQISEKGHDICLHTPDHFTTTPDRFEEALIFMKSKFGSPTWIDHGNNNGPQNNREDLICDATLKKSPYYALDLWEENGVSYLHNAYYEELNTFKDWLFEPSIEKPYSGFGDFFPKPDYYKHPTLTKDLYHWTTSSAMFVNDHYLWNYLFNPEKIKRFVDNWYVEINHVYPAWVDPKKGMWMYDNDSTIVAQYGFNNALAILSELRDEGRLNITTIADFLDYRTALDNVDYEIQIDGRIKVTNNSNLNIENLSMVAKAEAITVNQLIPAHKKTGNEIIFWFNLAPGESKTIRIIE